MLAEDGVSAQKSCRRGPANAPHPLLNYLAWRLGDPVPLLVRIIVPDGWLFSRVFPSPIHVVKAFVTITIFHNQISEF
jgi:hypothetical protein